MPPFIDLTNQKFGRLTVLNRAENNKFNQVCWKCQCACGSTIIATACHLKSGHTQSCGCFYREKIAAGCAITHGLRQAPEYNSWAGMIGRCHNPKNQSFKNYGGRKITVCDEWRNSFLAFYEHIGQKPSKKLTIERINNSKGYVPGNVRWATQQEQNNNCSRNRCITIKNHTMTMTQWATFVGIDKGTLWNRLKKNWPIEKAIFKPVRSHKPYSKNI